MAKPRIFVSSTFYDLQHIRADLARFVEELGYEAILNERGDIPYGHDEPLEEYCYKEISLCDILVSIVGGRYGSESTADAKSISQMELRAAIEQNKPVFIFVQSSVKAQLEIFRLNKDKDITYPTVDNKKIFEFIEELEKLPKNNPIFTFENSSDIMVMLKDQWAGLFQRMIRMQSRYEEVRMANKMESVAQTLNEMVEYFKGQREKDDSTIFSILMANHPAFVRIKEIIAAEFRIYFTNFSELVALLKHHGYEQDPHPFDDSLYEFDRKRIRRYRDSQGAVIRKEVMETIGVDKAVFNEDGSLRIYTVQDWSDDLIQYDEHVSDPDDDIPF